MAAGRPKPAPCPSDAEPFYRALPWLAFIAFVFFLCFLARIIFAPLLPSIETEIGISHSQATRFFFFISGGYAIGLLGSGFLTCRINHRATVCLSAAWVGVCLILLGLAHDLRLIYTILLIFGIGAGLYLPSGISVVVSLVKARDIGKAISIHELAPTAAFLCAPFLVEICLRWMTWRGVLAGIGALSLLAGLAFALFGRGDTGKTRPPRPDHFLIFFKRPAFWTLAAISCMGIAVSMGVFSVLPIFLVDEQHFSQDWANSLTALSRIGCPFAAVAAGWASDRFGALKTVAVSVVLAGALTAAVGLSSGSALVTVILLQGLPAAAISPLYFAMLSTIFPAEERNVAISLIVPIGVFGGAGIVPALIGLLADAGLFHLGFIGMGALTLAILPLLHFVKGAGRA